MLILCPDGGEEGSVIDIDSALSTDRLTSRIGIIAKPVTGLLEML